MILPAIDLVDGPISSERGSYWVVCADIDGVRWDAAWADDLGVWDAEILDLAIVDLAATATADAQARADRGRLTRALIDIAAAANTLRAIDKDDAADRILAVLVELDDADAAAAKRDFFRGLGTGTEVRTL